MKRAAIDFAEILGRADVRKALKELSSDPDNAALQRKADRLLAEGPLFRKKTELRIEQEEMSSDRQSSFLEGIHLCPRLYRSADG